MPARFLKETEIQEAILTEIKKEVEVIKAAHGVVPGPVIIFVGSNPVSLSYVSLKINPARSHGEESARQLQRWLVESDVATDPQAFIISPESSVELARVIVNSDSHYPRRRGRGVQAGGVAARCAHSREVVAHRAQRGHLVRHHMPDTLDELPIANRNSPPRNWHWPIARDSSRKNTACDFNPK